MNTETEIRTAQTRRVVRRKTPLALRVMRIYFSTVGQLFPGMAARKAYKIWFRTRRYKVPLRETRWLKDANQDVIDHPYGPLAVNRWGEHGPTVLLVHGWNGRGSQMGAFAAPLVEAGYRVVAYDLPAHGRSPGNNTNVFKAIETLMAVAEAYGPIHGIVGHSFGGMVTTLALKEGLPANRVICIGTPGSLLGLLERFTNVLAIPEATLSRLNQMIVRKFSNDIWDRVSLISATRDLSTPALIIHDEFDLDVDWKEAEAIANSWQGAQFMKTSGLGHRRILRDPEVIAAAVSFLNEK
ncbi:MAG: alpha/beta fold hydrolase [Acidiferrobacterales bacterium]